MTTVDQLAAIVGRHTTLRKVCDHYVGRCPFPTHTDLHPSFVVKKGRNGEAMFFCSCSAGGATSFLMRMEGKTWSKAQAILRGDEELYPTHEQIRQQIAAQRGQERARIQAYNDLHPGDDCPVPHWFMREETPDERLTKLDQKLKAKLK